MLSFQFSHTRCQLFQLAIPIDTGVVCLAARQHAIAGADREINALASSRLAL